MVSEHRYSESKIGWPNRMYCTKDELDWLISVVDEHGESAYLDAVKELDIKHGYDPNDGYRDKKDDSDIDWDIPSGGIENSVEYIPHGIWDLPKASEEDYKAAKVEIDSLIAGARDAFKDWVDIPGEDLWNSDL